MRIRVEMSGHHKVAYRHYAFLFVTMLLILAACGNETTASTTPTANSIPKLAAKQILTFPNVGIADSDPLDPALVSDQNTGLIVNMIYSGLVRSDINLNVVPDQATWDISADDRVYTFHLKTGIAFSDGTPVTAQTYVYTLTRVLLPEVESSMAALFEGSIVGANDVIKGKTKILSGVKALDNQTLRITLTRPTPYFLQMLTNSLFSPLNKRIIDEYGQSDWPNHVVDSGVGTGPFMIQKWDRSVKMVFVPNPYYYGDKTKLTQVNMIFTNDATTALNTYRAGQYDFVWNMTAVDQMAAVGLPGFTRSTQLETDTLFFNNKIPPFDNVFVRQAFAYATDKVTLAHAIFNDSVVPAQTIIPQGMPGYQQNNVGIPFDKNMAKTLLQAIYPDPTTIPPITFSYSSSTVNPQEAAALQKMWQDALGIQITLRSVETTAYADELNKHQIQFGFTQWNADFPDPYDCLTLNLFSMAANNYGGWSNPDFDQAVTQADKVISSSTRDLLYNQAEQIAIQEVGWLPLDHQTLAAIIPSLVHGVSVNANGLYFGDWSQVYLLQH
ncbi:MAG: peptide ABC transporter substrate-binding protein [Chloroflexota bacterium]|nr:peptide ABC transporter substrate-binding protein [Chloroflexota bacterium]